MVEPDDAPGTDNAGSPVVADAADAADRVVLDVSLKLAGAATSIAKRLTLDVAAQTVEVGLDVLAAARAGRPASELATRVVDGWVDGARNVLGIDRDLREIGEQVGRIARPAGALVPPAVQSAVAGLAGPAITGGSVQDVRRELRRQGMELLRRSAALDDPEEHPAFRTILNELAPDEARIVRHLALDGPKPTVDAVAYSPLTRRTRELLRHFSLIGREAGCMRPALTGVYLDNLIRLGLVHPRSYRVAGQQDYDLLHAQPELKQVRRPAGRLTRIRLRHYGVELSEFGRQLYEQCFTPEP